MKNQTQIAIRVSWISIIANAVLSAVKLAAGLLAQSGAMISDAIHSASDVFSTIIVMIGVKLSSKAADKEHAYGHERLECVAAIVLAMVLMSTGLLIGYEGVQKIFFMNVDELPIPGQLAVFAAIISIIVKEIMFWYTRYYAKLIDCNALMADAWHHRSDSLSSVGALVGIVGARFGLPILEPIASVIICLFIGKAAFDIFMDAVNKMVDHNCDADTENAIRSRILTHSGIHTIDLFRTRQFGSRIYVDLEISVNGLMSLIEAHEIAKKIHDDIENVFPKVKHIMIHVNPAC